MADNKNPLLDGYVFPLGEHVSSSTADSSGDYRIVITDAILVEFRPVKHDEE